MNKKILAVLLASAFVVTGCGGGGGKSGSSNSSGSGSSSGGSGGTSTPSNSWLALTPSAVDLSVIEGDAQEFTVVAKSSKTISQTFNVGVVDKAGLIQPSVELKTITPYEYSAKMKLATTLKPGSYTTRLEVRLCEDDPATCAKPIQGSPWYVPLNVTVKAAANLKPLADLPNVGVWHGIGGSVAHTGYIPGRFDPAGFSSRFVYNFPLGSTDYVAGELAIENGIIFMNVSRNRLRAMDEATGNVLWTTALRSGNSTGPIISDGKVYVGVDNTVTIANMVGYDKLTGSLINAFAVGDLDPMSGLEAHSGQLLVKGFSSVKRASTTYLWIDWEKSMKTESFMALTADANNIYTFDQTNVSVIRASDGATVSAPFSTSSSCAAPWVHATDGKGMLYGVCHLPGADRQLRAIDTTMKQTAWSVNGNYEGRVALGGTTLYALNSGALEARSASDGKLLWSTNLVTGTDALPEAFTVLVTDNLAFVSSMGTAGKPSKTVAVELSTHKVVWSYPYGGEMAISSKGVLYIAGDTKNANTSGLPGKFVAVNLR
ncbi:MAG TPA: PQQ-binding-like beta-propeller repeat protein [Pseudoduganella sp.]